MLLDDSRGRPLRLRQKLLNLNWSLVLLICVVASVGLAVLYSVGGADGPGEFQPWASRQLLRFVGCFALMIVVAMIDLRLLMRFAYSLYAAVLVLLVLVELFGRVGMGAQRWIDLGIIQLQPSEFMRLALVLALARYFHGLSYEEIGRPLFLIPPLLMVALPAVLVLKQPDLGTTVLLIAGSGAIFFLAGVRIWKFIVVLVLGLAALPVAWEFLHDYQQKRVLMFMNPEDDPLGAGYHILQSKIAVGSGGVFGKGYLEGTQSHLNFLPEHHTDFIFTVLAEEFGMVGAVMLLLLYVLILGYGYAIGLRSRSQFGRLVALGVTATFFLYVFINIAMVMGLLPVVGVPLPLVSYGGSSMMTLMAGIGLILSVSVHRDVMLPRRGDEG